MTAKIKNQQSTFTKLKRNDFLTCLHRGKRREVRLGLKMLTIRRSIVYDIETYSWSLAPTLNTGRYSFILITVKVDNKLYQHNLYCNTDDGEMPKIH